VITVEGALVETIRFRETPKFIDRYVACHVAPSATSMPPQRLVDEDHRLATEPGSGGEASQSFLHRSGRDRMRNLSGHTGLERTGNDPFSGWVRDHRR
jgi:hypothetical protein